MLHNKEILKDRRRELRRKETKEEKILWSKIRGGKLGAKFKRQHSIGGYILDFYCSEFKLIVELDGGVHNNTEAKEYDKIRDKYFRELGYLTLRFFNSEIKNNLQQVLSKIKSYLTSPLPHKERGRGEVEKRINLFFLLYNFLEP